jgi:hypothetical protein
VEGTAPLIESDTGARHKCGIRRRLTFRPSSPRTCHSDGSSGGR